MDVKQLVTFLIVCCLFLFLGGFFCTIIEETHCIFLLTDGIFTIPVVGHWLRQVKALSENGSTEVAKSGKCFSR